MTITSNYSTLPVGQPHPNAAIQKLPVVVREKVDGARLPVQYEQAVKALAECVAIDEAKHWADKAEALAAWAKVYKDDQVAIEARRLKLHAYRRINEISLELSPRSMANGKGSGRRGCVPGTGQTPLLKRHGFSGGQIRAIQRIGKATEEEFDDALRRGLTPTAATVNLRGRGAKKATISDAWMWLHSSNRSSVGLMVTRSLLRQRDPKDVAFLIAPGEVKKARELAIELIEWLDEFEQALPKDEQK